MELKYKLLEHPFYRAWKDGSLTIDEISKYSHGYLRMVESIPRLWQTSLSGLGVEGSAPERIIAEEREHIGLWRKWMDQLPRPSKDIAMDDTIAKLLYMKPSEMLGAIHSFEVQQPEVANEKKNILMKFYGFNEDQLTYFDEHMNEEPHINFGSEVAEKFADREQYRRGIENGARIFYDALDKFC
mgnify:CR=1 FL=1